MDKCKHEVQPTAGRKTAIQVCGWVEKVRGAWISASAKRGCGHRCSPLPVILPGTSPLYKSVNVLDEVVEEPLYVYWCTITDLICTQSGVKHTGCSAMCYFRVFIWIKIYSKTSSCLLGWISFICLLFRVQYVSETGDLSAICWYQRHQS